MPPDRGEAAAVCSHSQEHFNEFPHEVLQVKDL